MTGRGLYIYGAGGHGRVVAEAAEAAGLQVRGFLDDAPPPGGKVGKWSVEQPGSMLGFNVSLHVAVGDNRTRRALADRLRHDGHLLARVIHPSAIVSDSAVGGSGVYVGACVVINAGARIEDGVIVNTAAVVEHDCAVGAFSHIAPGAILCGSVSIGRLTLVGAGAVVLPGVRVGHECTIGAGATVTRDVADGATVVGTPARVCAQ